jgi:hypothetical protein
MELVMGQTPGKWDRHLEKDTDGFQGAGKGTDTWGGETRGTTDHPFN